MEGTKEFLLLRYSLVEERQGVFAVLPLPVPKGLAVLEGLSQDREFSVNGVVYSFVGFAKVLPTQLHKFPIDRFVLGKVAKLRQAHMGKKVPGDIVETSEDDWQPVVAVFDLHQQYIVIERDWRFGTPEQTVRALQGGLRYPLLEHYNHSIFVEGCVRKEHFWNIVGSHRKLYKLELKLISPNILETNLRARDALAALKDLFGQDQVKIGLANEQGELCIPQNPIDDYLEYIAEGEGTWSLTTEGVHGGKKTHSSSDNIETVQLPDGREAGLHPAEPERDIHQRHEAALIEQVYHELERYLES